MSIIYPLAFPAMPQLRQLKLSAQDLVGEVVGEFDGSQQEQQWQGQWWELEGSWPPMLRAQAEAIVAFLTSLHGKLGTFTWSDPLGMTPQGNVSGAPLVWDTVAQRDQTLPTRGWTPNTAGVLLPGDYVQPVPATGNPPRLYKVLTPANSDNLGHAVLDVFPSIREQLTDGTVIITQNCQGTFRLTENLRAWNIDVTRVYGISFKAKEAI